MVWPWPVAAGGSCAASALISDIYDATPRQVSLLPGTHPDRGFGLPNPLPARPTSALSATSRLPTTRPPPRPQRSSRPTRAVRDARRARSLPQRAADARPLRRGPFSSRASRALPAPSWPVPDPGAPQTSNAQAFFFALRRRGAARLPRFLTDPRPGRARCARPGPGRDDTAAADAALRARGAPSSASRGASF